MATREGPYDRRIPAMATRQPLAKAESRLGFSFTGMPVSNDVNVFGELQECLFAL
jgi:hypothetical protein